MRHIIRNWRKWLVAWAFIALAMGQQSNTVFQNIATNTVTKGVQPAKPRQIGQSFHLVSVRYATGCLASWEGSVYLEASFDNTNWMKIGNIITLLIPGEPKFLTAAGSFPYLRINYPDGTTSAPSCGLTIDYSGNITGSTITNTISPVNDGFTYYSSNVVLTGPLDTVVASCNPGQRVTMYSAAILNTLATVFPTDTKLIFATNPASGPTTDWQIPLKGVLGGSTYITPNGPRPVYQQTIPNVAAQTSSLTLSIPAFGEASFTGVFRCE